MAQIEMLEQDVSTVAVDAQRPLIGAFSVGGREAGGGCKGDKTPDGFCPETGMWVAGRMHHMR